MSVEGTNRREFLKLATAAAAGTMPTAAGGGQKARAPHSDSSNPRIDLMRRPDHVTARFDQKNLRIMQYAGSAWTCPGVRVTAEPIQVPSHAELPILLTSDGKELTYLHLRWEGKESEGSLSIGDHWERSYGDLEWRGTLPERVMPWYFLTFDGERVDGYGVKTQASTFCFWQRDPDGITLSIDLRNGGEGTELAGRELHACTVVTRVGHRAESIFEAGKDFCKMMCPAPRLLAGALFGANDWNYAYGKNTAAGILRDADLVASLAPSGSCRPHIVIDDGWQDPKRFPSMSDLSAEIRRRELVPGLWIRPLQARDTTPPAWLLPDLRFGKNAVRTDLALDPTLPEALDEVLKTVRTAVSWGYEFIKHDFSTYELFGRWGFDMRTGVTRPGWSFHDKSRTNAEIVRDLYHSIRVAAGEKTTILGCNTVGHLAAGIFESQRIADDTSGRDWERTRRYGVNGLSHRIIQHHTFCHIDPDCVAITASVGWKETSQWMDVVARSGTSLFFSPDPAAVTPEIKSAIKDAMLIASQSGYGYPVQPTSGTTPTEWRFSNRGELNRKYDWCGPEGVTPFDV